MSDTTTNTQTSMGIDYEAVLKNPKVKKALAAAKGLDRNDEDAVHDWVGNTIGDKGKDVFELSTDEACDTVKKWHGQYYLFASEYEPDGPHESIEEAMSSVTIFGAEYDDASITSSELSEEDMKDIALQFIVGGGTVTIGDTVYTVVDGELVEGQVDAEEE